MSKKSAAKKTVRTAAKKAADKARARRARNTEGPTAATPGAVTLEEARTLVRRRAVAAAPAHPGMRRAAGHSRALPSRSAIAAPSPAEVGKERKRLRLKQQRERQRRICDYKATLSLMKRRGVKGLPATPEPEAAAAAGAGAGRRRAAVSREASRTRPLQIFAEGDSWFDYPPFIFKGGIIPRLEDRLGVPILNLAKAGDEVRFMLGVEEREILIGQFKEGCPAGGPWDVLLFSGGGNDIVSNPMALWVRDFVAGTPPADLIHQQRYATALALVRAGYEDLITLRDTLSPHTHLIFHAYDYAIPDGRGVCFLGPWLEPTFKLRGFPKSLPLRSAVVKVMLQEFARLLQSLEQNHPKVTFINGQGTLAPKTSSWHNELHPESDGFELFADLFHVKLKGLFPSQVL